MDGTQSLQRKAQILMSLFISPHNLALCILPLIQIQHFIQPNFPMVQYELHVLLGLGRQGAASVSVLEYFGLLPRQIAKSLTHLPPVSQKSGHSQSPVSK